MIGLSSLTLMPQSLELSLRSPDNLNPLKIYTNGTQRTYTKTIRQGTRQRKESLHGYTTPTRRTGPQVKYIIEILC